VRGVRASVWCELVREGVCTVRERAEGEESERECGRARAACVRAREKVRERARALWCLEFR